MGAALGFLVDRGRRLFHIEAMQLDEQSAERLWMMFFPHLTRAMGIALIQELLRIHFKQKS